MSILQGVFFSLLVRIKRLRSYLFLRVMLMHILAPAMCFQNPETTFFLFPQGVKGAKGLASFSVCICWLQQSPSIPWHLFISQLAGPGVCWLIHSVLSFELQTCELIQYVRDHSRKYPLRMITRGVSIHRKKAANSAFKIETSYQTVS